MKGKVKWYNRVKGYGFIESDEGGADVFFHWTGLRDEKAKVEHQLADTPGTPVEFEEGQGAKGRVAAWVKIVPAPAAA